MTRTEEPTTSERNSNHFHTVLSSLQCCHGQSSLSLSVYNSALASYYPFDQSALAIVLLTSSNRFLEQARHYSLPSARVCVCVLLFTHSTTPHPTPLPRPLMPHLSYTLIIQTIPSTHSTRSSQVTHLNSTHSRLLRSIPCPVLRPIC